MQIVNIDRRELAPYIRRQLSNILPMEDDPKSGLIDTHMAAALERVERCLSAIRMWPLGQFNVLQSGQYCIFLYFLANTIWRAEHEEGICTRLFLLNKALNSIDCFYEIELPDVFLIGHSSGIVLAKATYGNYLVLHQNCTVGKNHGVAPEIGDRVVLYPNSAVIGRSRVGSGTVVAQGVSVINRDTPGESVAFSGLAGDLVFKKMNRNVMEDFFRDI